MPAPAVRVTTESGAVYELTGALKKSERSDFLEAVGKAWLRRWPPDDPERALRNDTEWVPLLRCTAAVGQPMRALVQLRDNPINLVTLRVTTPVTAIIQVIVEDEPCM